jgi:hypothetical protein
VLLADVPVTYLLFLEKELADLHAFISRIPVLNPAETWHFDENVGVYVTDVVKTVRSQKIPKVLVRYEATEKHPAQTEVYYIDEPVGDWSKVAFSGALPAQRQKVLLGRVLALADAVKIAREKANQAEVEDRRTGKVVFDYLFA